MKLVGGFGTREIPIGFLVDESFDGKEGREGMDCEMGQVRAFLMWIRVLATIISS